jgi:hypothetical protein
MAADPYPVDTKRQVIAQVTVCCGCCCGNTERGLPAVPVDWLKTEWRERGLLRRVQLTISGCVGPCDVPNVVVITTPAGSEWLGNLSETAHYRSLLEWAVECRDLGQVLELPHEFSKHALNPFVASVLQLNAWRDGR